MPWHLLDVELPRTPVFKSAMLMMIMPSKYRITGSQVWSDEERKNTPFYQQDNDEISLAWKGRTAAFTKRRGTFEQAYTITLDKSYTAVRELTFRRVSDEVGEVARFSMKDLPLLTAERLEQAGLELRIFGVGGAAMRKHVKSFHGEVAEWREETERDGYRKVRSHVKETITDVGTIPKDGGTFFVLLMLSNLTKAEMDALPTSGKLSQADFEALTERMQAAMHAAVGAK